MKRLFLILHAGGVADAYAESASEAESKAFVPGGVRNTLAVIDAAVIAFAGTPFGFEPGYAVSPRDPSMPVAAVIGDAKGGFLS